MNRLELRTCAQCRVRFEPTDERQVLCPTCIEWREVIERLIGYRALVRRR